MNNTMNYRGYVGSVEFSERDEVFYGKVMGIRALISYEGKDARELVEDFHTAVDDYFVLCESEGKEPERSYKGSFNIRISPELHREAAVFAIAHQMSLNSFVEEAVSEFLSAQSR
ncbi:MAG: type II toxin-antitoxin system HicB family antitoxin [Clostridiales bacterium]|nr:type II toxin-antitoxin system HicB family antitoxin [Clostridiales bacterium]